MPHRLAGVGAPPSAYVHIPFCHRVCPYCDFAVVAGRLSDADRYVSAVIREIERSDAWEPLGAVFIGGGTPSAVDPKLIGQLLDTLEAKHGFQRDMEITLESNPEDWAPEKAEGMLAAGVNRVSIGAQSFDPVVLAALGRQHGPDDVGVAVAVCRSEGFNSVSVDLIFGHPMETTSSWSDTLRRVTDLAPDHVSTYALTVERGTQLSRDVNAGSPAPDDDDQADRYEATLEAMAAVGLERYEVSNFSQIGRECRYNRRVWAHGSYEAYGLGAHGYRDGVRFRNVRALDAYLARVEAGGSARAGREALEGWPVELERMMVGLRRIEGVELGPGGGAFLASEAGQRLVQAEVVAQEGDRLVVTNPLMTDAVIRAVLALPQP
jgi:putative oxygen-independent coproporphyrinogen III oxidase